MQIPAEWFFAQGLTQYFEASFQELVWFSKRELASSEFLIFPGACNSTGKREFFFHTHNMALEKEEKCPSRKKLSHTPTCSYHPHAKAWSWELFLELSSCSGMDAGAKRGTYSSVSPGQRAALPLIFCSFPFLSFPGTALHLSICLLWMF